MKIKEGELSSGKKWELVEGRNKGVKEGKHLILHPVGDLPLEDKEEKELLSLSLDLAAEYAIAPGRFRIALNGPGLRTQSTFHIHIIIPAGKDMLPRLVWTIDEIISRFK